MATISARLVEIKDDPTGLFEASIVESICRDVGHRRRDRTLDPTSTLRVFAAQVAHGNTAIAHAIRLVGGGFSESAYCQARARLPLAVLRAVRAVRYRTRGKGLRSREITLMTTLLDAAKYPAAALVELCLTRWRVEVNLRHLRRTMGVDRLKCHSVEGVMRELVMFALRYNTVCRARTAAAVTRGIEPTRLGFIDALRAVLLGQAGPDASTAPTPPLKPWPRRPPRIQPRQVKRLHSTFRMMNLPRPKLIAWIESRQNDAK